MSLFSIFIVLFFSWYKMYMSCNMKIWIIHTSQSICRDQCRHLEPTAGSGNGDIDPSSPSWGGLSETVSHRLRCLNTWSLVCSVVWGGFGDVGLLEEACHCGRALQAYSLCLLPFCSLSALCVWFRMGSIRYLFLPPCLIHATVFLLLSVVE